MLLEMLQALLTDKIKIYTSTRVLEYKDESDRDKPIELVFDDGSTRTADIVIGADGVHSLTRAEMYRLLQDANPEGGYDKFIHSIWSGTYAYRAHVDLEKFKAMYPDHLAVDNPMLVRISCVSFWVLTSERLFFFECSGWERAGT